MGFYNPPCALEKPLLSPPFPTISPKSTAFPSVLISTYAMSLAYQLPVNPRVDTALVELVTTTLYPQVYGISPKSAALPVDAMVT